jgi:sialate O-acetylesterase
MKTRTQLFCFASVLASFAQTALADVKLPAIFSDHMVLQQETTVPVWGWAEPGEEVTVSIAGQSQSTKAGAAGKWSVKLARLKVGDTLTLTVKGRNTITVQDVLVGEVWLCSGQSNMAMTVNRAKDFDQEKSAANFPKLRMFFEQSAAATEPKEQGRGVWQVCSPETVGNFSATAYFFGREVHQKLGVPVGIINSSVGGTAIEAWTSWDAQKGKAELKQPVFDRWEKMQADWTPEKAAAAYEKQLAAYKLAVAKAKAGGKPEPRAPRKQVEPRLDGNHPANLYNGKISPLIPYAIRGAIWYQGESNAGIGQLYRLQLTTMIKDWRARWGYDFPFAWVQLPDFHAAQKEPVEDTGWVHVREGMLQTLSLPRTGMAITLGLGEAGDIHPKNKQDVGRRLAFWALGDVYKQKGVAISGPLPDGHKIRGNEVTLSFTHTDGGLVIAQGGGELKGFAIAGADKKWVKAAAKILGDKVVVSSPEVARPAAVRYAWADNPEFSLYNGAGLPATPFRTDDWK